MARGGWALVLWAAILAGCVRADMAPAPVPTAAPTAPPAIAPLPPPASSGELISTALGATYTNPQHRFALQLPAEWRAMVPPAQIDAHPAELHANTREAPAPFDHVATGKTLSETLDLIAALPGNEGQGPPRAQLTVMALPTHALSLPLYLEQTTQMMALASGTQVQDSWLDPSLRQDGLPVAVIEYTTNQPAPRSGYQATFVGDDPSILIVLTFTAPTDQYIELRPQFIQIVQMVDTAFTPAFVD